MPHDVANGGAVLGSVDASLGGVQPGSSCEFDPDLLRERYRVERDKRARPKGIDQYIETTGGFGEFAIDPYVKPGFERARLVDDVEVLIMGGGFGGLLAAVRLRQAGFRDLRIIEKAGDFGGVWYWNRYPGARCDTEAYIYLPLLEETGYIPTEKYVLGSEIRAHAQRIGEHFDLYRSACFQTQVERLSWIEEEKKWLVATDRGDRFKARYVITSSGPMDRPKLPGIPGIASFGGKIFHTSRWDYDYTGGDINGNLTKLSSKKVAVIGTGCTAIQAVPRLAESAAHLYVFQRTPSTVDTRENGPTDLDWVRRLSPGWQQRRNMNFIVPVSDGSEQGGLFLGRAADEDTIDDGWTANARALNAIPTDVSEEDLTPEARALALEIADFRKMNELRTRIDETVKDRDTAEALKPWYRLMCKRPGFSDEYLQTFNRPNVTLIDTAGRGVDEIRKGGVVFDGVEHPVDCIILATGFEVGTTYTRRPAFEVDGRDGRILSDYWASGFRTFQGFYTNGFPNYFHMGPVQGGISTNIPHLLDEQSRHIAEVLQMLRLRKAKSFEPSAEAEAAWVAEIVERAGTTKDFWNDCTPGYFNNEGENGTGLGLIENIFVGKPLEYFELIQAWRSSGRLEGLVVEY